MKAWVLHDIKEFKLEEVEKPELGNDEVLVKVKATGICGSDIARIYMTGAYSYPLVPGHEFSGVVVGLGTNVDKRWLGRRVGTFPLIPCGECIPCKKKQYEMCKQYSYLGSRRSGGFAEYVAVPMDNLIEIPDNVGFDEAAMLEPMAVAVHAMRRVIPNESDVVAICGLGTIGLLLFMFLWEAGIRNILVIGNKEIQKETAMRMGVPCDNYFDNRHEEAIQWIERQTNGLGVSVFFDCVGKNETLVQAIRSTSPGGRICLVGNPSSGMNLEKDVYWQILRNQLTIFGTWNSSFSFDNKKLLSVMAHQTSDWQYALERLAQKRISPIELISHKFLLEELIQGFHIMRDKTEEYIKIIAVCENK